MFVELLWLKGILRISAVELRVTSSGQREDLSLPKWRKSQIKVVSHLRSEKTADSSENVWLWQYKSHYFLDTKYNDIKTSVQLSGNC